MDVHKKPYGAGKTETSGSIKSDADDEEKVFLRQELARLEQTVQETELKCRKYLEDKKKLKSNMNHLKRQLVDVKAKLNIANSRYEESIKKLTDATVEWRSFQEDLLTAVKVANDLKMEAQENVERLTVKNKKLNERIPILEAQICRLQDQLGEHTSSASSSSHIVNKPKEGVQKKNRNAVTDKLMDDMGNAATCSDVNSGCNHVVDGLCPTEGPKSNKANKCNELAPDAIMLPPKVIPRRSVSVQPFSVTVAPRSPLRSISIDPVPSNTTNTSSTQLSQGPNSRDPFSYPSSRKSIAKYVDFRTASQMSVKNLVMSLENANKSIHAQPTIATSPVVSPSVVVLRQQSLKISPNTIHPPVAIRFSNPELTASKINLDNSTNNYPHMGPMKGDSQNKDDQITTVIIQESKSTNPSFCEGAGTGGSKQTKRPCAITSSLEIIPTHEDYTQVQNKNNEENSRPQVQLVSLSNSPKKSPNSSPTSPLNKPLVLFKMENLRSNFR